MNESPCYTLSEATEEYLAMRGVDKLKYFSRYLVCAKNAYKEVFKTVLWTTKNVWQPLRKGDPYNYIDVPIDLQRLFSINEQDDCGNIIPLYYNNKLNVI